MTLEWLRQTPRRRVLRHIAFRLAHGHLYDDGLQMRRLLRLREMSEGRSVAVVGNAESLLSQAHGERIDGCDVVVRMNRGFVVQPMAQGTRTDVLFVSGKSSLEEIRKHCSPSLIVYPSPLRMFINPNLVASPELACMPFPLWRALVDELGTRPSTGIMALHAFRALVPTARVHLFGFDWKLTPTFYTGIVETKINHDWERERGVVRRWLERDPEHLVYHGS